VYCAPIIHSTLTTRNILPHRAALKNEAEFEGDTQNERDDDITAHLKENGVSLPEDMHKINNSDVLTQINPFSMNEIPLECLKE